ncbi:unnamed protein product [Microthlaspi erraticum]|uniref:Uncharacterized protein n=1 Tax=Microthlaspi erraticum TaxID=1685480 RepID=A0A6D2JAU9_9BRAS|nr:unnamed protein product [Microthlaspi erraticum]
MPIDLILEILSRATAKSVARFRLASKFCASIVRRPDFTELFLTRSSARPRLLFAIKGDRKWSFYSSPQLARVELRSNSSSLVVAADYQVKLPGYTHSEICDPVSGLIYLPDVHMENKNVITVPVAYNPSTGQYGSCPQRRIMTRNYYYFRDLLGYDPVDKNFKVLSYDNGKKEYHILTLGARKESWRKIEFPDHHGHLSEGICINGVLYYLAEVYGYSPVPSVSRVSIACFDVRSEKIRFLDASMFKTSSCIWPYKLINYKGELGVSGLGWHCLNPDGKHTIEFKLWVLKDVKKISWSKSVFLARPEGEFSNCLAVVGATATGEIVFSMSYVSKPFYVFYFSPERNTTERVEIRGFEAFENPCKVHTFVDHVEDFKFIT